MFFSGIRRLTDAFRHRVGDQPPVRDGRLLLQLQDHQQDRSYQGTTLMKADIFAAGLIFFGRQVGLFKSPQKMAMLQHIP